MILPCGFVNRKSKDKMFVLVGCRRAAPKYCANMWWFIFLCVVYTKTITVVGSNITGAVPGSKYLLFLCDVIKCMHQQCFIFSHEKVTKICLNKYNYVLFNSFEGLCSSSTSFFTRHELENNSLQ